MKQPRVYIGPHEISGHYAYLARGLKELGVDCEFAPFFSHPFNYGGEGTPPHLIRAARRIRGIRLEKHWAFPPRAILALLERGLLGAWGVTAMMRYNVFIFGFGGSLFPQSNWDLKLLRRMGKVVICNLGHGSEARPPYVDGSYQSFDGSTQPTAQFLAQRARAIRNRVHRIEAAADLVIGSPLSTAYFSEKQMVNWFAIGIPRPPAADTATPSTSSEGNRTERKHHGVRIVHAPSHPAVKGTQVILESIERLRRKGHEIELVLLHGKPHSEVMQQLDSCDFVIDQLYSDTPMSGFATEAAVLAKPAVVAGYGLQRLKAMVAPDMWPPSAICEPDEIDQTIERLILDPDARRALGREAQQFVQEKWNHLAVAQRYLDLIRGKVPPEWCFNPATISYLEGCGQPLDQTKDNVKKMVEKYQVRSLRLGHRPDLEQAFLEFAQS